MSSDVLVIGAGPNGLAAAALLARAGRRVTVLEAAEVPGGAARSEEAWPGWHLPRLAHLVTMLHPEVIRALDLGAHGLDLSAAPAPTTLLSPAGPVLLSGAWGERVSGVSAGEARAWAAFRARALGQAAVLRPFLSLTPPGGAPGLGDLLPLGRAALGLRLRGREAMRDFLRMALVAAADAAEEGLADSRLQGLVAFDATLGGALSPRAPTTWLGLLYRLTGMWNGKAGAAVLPRGGAGAVARALAASARAAGAEIRCGARVARIETAGGRVTGVTLRDGRTLAAPRVLSAIAPQATLLSLLGPARIETETVLAMRAIRARGRAGKINLALDAMPDLAQLPPEAATGRLVLAPSVADVERAAVPAKYGESPETPVMEAVFPHLAAPGSVPPGRAALSVIVQSVPERVVEAPAFLARCIAQLGAHLPGIPGLVRHAEFLAPADIEAGWGLPGGHWHHGELAPDALFALRPAFGLARYRGPVPGLWLSGAGTHPGGGVSGIAGLNAARAVMEDGG